MSHWAELDESNIVLRVLVGDNNDPVGDEGYQWLIDNLGGTWIKTSYNNKIDLTLQLLVTHTIKTAMPLLPPNL